MKFNSIKKHLKKEFTNFPEVKLAILGDSATQILSKAIRSVGYIKSLNVNFYESEYNQIEHNIYDTNSNLFSFSPEFIFVYKTSQKLYKQFYKLKTIEERRRFSLDKLQEIERQVDQISKFSNAKIVLNNFNEIDNREYGHFSNNVESSFLFQLRDLNHRISLLAIEKNVSILDLQHLQSIYGANSIIDNKYYISSDLAFSLDFHVVLAESILAIINAHRGILKKCLILDLDNTLWGGIIGDDGIEKIQIGNLGIGKAFTEIQNWAKSLEQRGIILAICSKNTESVAKQPFIHHPEMVLRLDDISVFVANWNNKADNIRYIREMLNISYDSMVFLDDNPAERALVRESFPMISIPELPQDPSEYIGYLRRENLFETASISKNDSTRTNQYKVEAKRRIVQQSFTDMDSFLENLEMIGECKLLDNFNCPRISQLSQRSNQFNLRTVRYSEDQLVKMMELTNYSVLSFSMKDKFGDNGLVAIVVLLELNDLDIFIENWIMSCRVLNRGMEHFVLNELIKFTKNTGHSNLIGEWIGTDKNNLVKDHYSNLGFEDAKKGWILDINNFKKIKTYIK
jgi:FkbH-like protein